MARRATAERRALVERFLRHGVANVRNLQLLLQAYGFPASGNTVRKDLASLRGQGVADLLRRAAGTDASPAPRSEGLAGAVYALLFNEPPAVGRSRPRPSSRSKPLPL